MVPALRSFLEFLRPRPWQVRTGSVSWSRIERRQGAILSYHETRFALSGVTVRYWGKVIPVCEGDEASVVGLPDGDEFHACFVAVPDWGWFHRSYSRLSCVLWALSLALMAIVTAALSLVVLAIVFALLAAFSASYALDWIRGERLARQYLWTESI